MRPPSHSTAKDRSTFPRGTTARCTASRKTEPCRRMPKEWESRQELLSTAIKTSTSATVAARFSKSTANVRRSCSRHSSLASLPITLHSVRLAICSSPVRPLQVSTASTGSTATVPSATSSAASDAHRDWLSTSMAIFTSPLRRMENAASYASRPTEKPASKSPDTIWWASPSPLGNPPCWPPPVRCTTCPGMFRDCLCCRSRIWSSLFRLFHEPDRHSLCHVPCAVFHGTCLRAFRHRHPQMDHSEISDLSSPPGDSEDVGGIRRWLDLRPHIRVRPDPDAHPSRVSAQSKDYDLRLRHHL